MKNTKILLLCMLVLLAGCTPKNEELKEEQKPIVNAGKNDAEQQPSDDEKEGEKEEAIELEKGEAENEEQPDINAPAQPAEPSAPSVPTPAEPAPVEPTQPSVEEQAPTNFDAVTAAIQQTDLFSMSMFLEAQQIADLYGNIGADQYEAGFVLKNMMSPGGDEIAVFKVKAGQMDAVKAGIQARDTYGKNEGSFYEMEKEMFDQSKMIEMGDVIVYIAARNVDELTSIVETNIK